MKGEWQEGLRPLEVAVYPLTGREMPRDSGDWSKAVAAHGYEQVSEGPFVNVRT